MKIITPKTVFTSCIAAIAILALPFSILAAQTPSQPQQTPLLTSTKVLIGDTPAKNIRVKASPTDPNTLDLTLDPKLLKKSCARVANTNNTEIPLLIQVTKMVNVTGASVKSGDNLKQDDVIAKKIVALTYTCPTKTANTQTTPGTTPNTQSGSTSNTQTPSSTDTSTNNPSTAGTTTTGLTDNTTNKPQPLDVQITVEKQIKTTQPTNQQNTTQPTKST